MSRSASPRHRSKRTGSPARDAGRHITPGISLCMIVRDEEKFLSDALASVAGVVDEICIIDTGSTDGTVDIARSFGASVQVREWRDDFAWARNEALALATRSWILVLDADERLAADSRDMVAALRTVRPAGVGRWIRCRNLADDVRGTGATSNAIVRIFPNDADIRYRGKLHEFVARVGDERQLPAIQTDIELIHHGYLTAVTNERKKGERNLRVALAELETHPDEPFAIYNHGMASLLAGDHVTAVRQLERACVLTEKTPRGFRPQALATLAGLYLNSRLPISALSTADQCAAVAPTFPDAHYMRGKALVALGRAHEARDAFGAAIAAGADAGDHFVVDDEIALWKAHNEIAGTLIREGRHADAQRWIDLALESRPAVQPLLLNRARCREAQGDIEGALIGFRSTFDGYRDELSAIDYVNFVFRHGSPDVALQAAEYALSAATEPYQRVFLGSGAAVMLRAGRRAEALLLVTRLMAIGGDSAAGRGTVMALAQQYDVPELNDLLREFDSRGAAGAVRKAP